LRVYTGSAIPISLKKFILPREHHGKKRTASARQGNALCLNENLPLLIENPLHLLTVILALPADRMSFPMNLVAFQRNWTGLHEDQLPSKENGEPLKSFLGQSDLFLRQPDFFLR
jgi:hypothetical protein